MGSRRSDITKELLEDMYWGREMSMRQIAKELGCSAMTISERMKKFGVKARPDNRDKYDFTPSYGPDMAYIVGVYIGDGCVPKKRSDRFTLEVTDKDFCEYTKRKLERVAEGVSEVKYYVRKYSHKDEYYDEYRVYCCNTDFASWLVFITDSKAKIPEFCKNDWLNTMAFLEGIMDSEGTMCKSKRDNCNTYKYQCSIGMDSELMNDIQEMFEAVGVKTNKMSLSGNCLNLPLNLESLVNSGFKFHIGRKQEVLEAYTCPHIAIDDDQIVGI